MANSILHSPKNTDSDRGFQPLDLIRGLVWKMAIAILILMAVGSATRVMNAGLACPDWPLCYGKFVPTAQMNLQVFLEWFHRLDAAAIGLMAIGLVGLCGWFWREIPRWLPFAALGILGLIVFQGVLGALTVTQLLRFDIVTAHLGTALLLFVAVLAVGFILMPYQGTGTARRLAWVGGVGAVLVYLQSLLGGLVASQWALHQCFGYQQLCKVMNGHIAGVVLPTLAVLILVVGAWRTPGLHQTLRQLAYLSGAVLVAQIGLGVATFYLHLQVELLTVTHQAVGAILLGSLVAFTILATRDGRTASIDRA
ncbi:MAG: heme A synthase [Cyanobacteriota bacterium]|nr:heme A synthase [Cyanobacteriota bacterium]